MVVPLIPSAILLSLSGYYVYRKTGTLASYPSYFHRINDALPNRYAQVAFWSFLALHPLEASLISGIVLRRGYGALHAVKWIVLGLGMGVGGMYRLIRRCIGYGDNEVNDDMDGVDE